MTAANLANGPLPVEPEAVLWRYVSLPSLLLYLSGRLRLSSVKALQRMDPLEGFRLWDHIQQTKGFSGSAYRNLFDYIKTRHLSPNEQELLNINAGHSGANQRVIFERWHRILLSTRYALCFFKSEHESISMWRLYAPHGFAIRTSFQSLEKALLPTKKKWRISRMKYVNKVEKVTHDGSLSETQIKKYLRRPFLLKSQEYQHEAEVRLFTVDAKQYANLVVDNVSPETWIKEIRISPEIWAADAKQLQDLIEQRCPKLVGNVRQSTVLSVPDSDNSTWQNFEAEFHRKDANEHWPELLRDP